jgi:hypothetical protein
MACNQGMQNMVKSHLQTEKQGKPSRKQEILQRACAAVILLR